MKKTDDGNRTLLICNGDKKFKVTIPKSSQLTFGPWAPPTKKGDWGGREERATGTLRVYGKTKTQLLAVFSPVTSFRDITLGYAEEVAREEGATIWKDDEKGYTREDKVSRQKAWVAPQLGDK